MAEDKRTAFGSNENKKLSLSADIYTGVSKKLVKKLLYEVPQR